MRRFEVETRSTRQEVTVSSRTTERSRRATSAARPADVEIHDVAAFLREALGAHLVALIVGVDPKTVDRWAKSSEREIRHESETRLRHTYEVFRTLQQVEAPPTVRAWFMGMNPQIDDLSPAEAIRDGRHREAMAAARAFVSGG